VIDAAAIEDGVVDEDDLQPDGNADGELGDAADSNADGDNDETTFTGSLGIGWGSDDADSDLASGSAAGVGDRSVYFSDTGSAVANVTVEDSSGAALDLVAGDLKSDGDPVQFALLDDGQTLVGYTGATVPTAVADGQVVFSVELSDDGTGSYTFTLFQKLDHPFNNDPNAAGIETAFEDDLVFTFDFTARDSDGDTDTTGSFQVTVDDDVPVTTGATGSVDETQPDAATGTLGAGEALGLTSIGNLSDPTTHVFRIDNPSSDAIAYSYRVAGDPTIYTGVAASGLSFFAVETGGGTPTVIVSYVAGGVGQQVTKAAGGAARLEGDALVPVGGLSGTIDVSMGADAQSLPDALTFDVSGLNALGLETTAGSAITATVDASSGWPKVDGTDESGELAFELFVRPNGSWVFTQHQALAHDDTGDANDTIVLDFAYTITDTDGDQVSDSIAITVFDDGPVIDAAAIEDGVVDEDDLQPDGNADGELGDAADSNADGDNDETTFTGSLGIGWGSDDADSDLASGSAAGVGDRSVYFSDTGSAVANVTVEDSSGAALDLVAGDLKSDGDPVQFALLDDGQTLVGYTGATVPTAVADGQVVFSVELSDDGTGSYTFTLFQKLDHPFNNDPNAAGIETAFEDDLVFTFDFTARDSDGDTDTTGSFQVTVDDDVPVTTGATGSVDETQPDAATGTLGAGEALGLTSIGNLSDPTTHVFRIDNPSSDAIAYSYRVAGDPTIYTGVAASGLSFFAVETGGGTPTVIVSYVAGGVGQQVTKAAGGAARLEGDALVPVGGLSGTIDVSMGADAQSLPDALTFDVSGLNALGLETTAGSAITATVDASSGWPKVDGTDESGELAFELFVRPNGSWVFTQHQALAHDDTGDANDTIVLDFAYTITDTDGDQVSDSIAITVFDDGPVIDAAAIEDGVVDEDDLQPDGNADGELGDAADSNADGDNDETTFTGSLGIGWGSDDADSDLASGSAAGVGDRSVYFSDTGSAVANVTVEDSSGAALDLVAGDLKSDGDPVQFALLDDGQTLVGYTGATVPTAVADGQVVFSVELSDDGTGSYTFTLFQKLDHPFNNDPNAAGIETAFEDDLVFTFDFTARDSDGDTDTTGSFQVTVDDDVPVTTGATGSVDETQPDAATGTLGAGEALGLTSIGNLSDPTTHVFRIDNPSSDAIAYSYRVAGDPTIYTGVAASGLSFFAVETGGGTPTVIVSYVAGGVGQQVTKAAGGAARLEGDALVPVGGLSGTIDVSMGADAQSLPDALTFDVSGLNALGLETTAGSAITATVDASSGWPKVDGTDESGELAFELFVRPNGSWVFTQHQALAHDDTGDANDTIVLDFAYTITDTDGDQVSDSIAITVFDDGPVIDAAAIEDGVVDEDDLQPDGNADGELGDAADSNADGDNDETTFTGSLGIGWGSDDADSDLASGSAAGVGDRSVYFSDTGSAVANVTVEDSSGAALDLVAGDLKSDGDPVQFALLDDGQTLVGYTGATVPTAVADGQVVFSVELSDDGTGSYTFTLFQKLDHPFNNDPNAAGIETAFEDDLVFTFDFTARDSDGDTDTTGSFQVTVDDDGR
jgi:hypothetical protein